ncbi:hypothetical protein SynSYN20_01273 [Synechococcus sp. SYN20]|nr:hypothetical protein SynSYN20_01273 [Synechococcus sp. SYN20]
MKSSSTTGLDDASAWPEQSSTVAAAIAKDFETMIFLQMSESI